MKGNVQAAFGHEKMLVYTLLLGLVNSIFGDWVFSGIFLSALFLNLTLFPLYFLTKELFGSSAALWAGIAWILLPAANELSTQVVKDPPFLFFMMLALWLGRKGLVERKKACFLMTFICAAFAALFRFEAIIFIVLYALWLIGRMLFHPEERSFARSGLIYYLAVPAIFSFVITGMFASGFYDHNVAEDIWRRFSQHYLYVDVLGNYHKIYDHLKAVERSFPGGQWTNDFFEIARRNMPLIYFIGIVEKLIDAIFPVYVVPLYFGVKYVNSHHRNIGLLVWTLVGYLGMVYFFIVTRNFLAERYLMIAVVVLLPFVGHGVEQLRLRMTSTRFHKSAMAAAVVFFVCLPLYKTIEHTRGEKIELRLAGEWLKEHGDVARQRMIATDERIPFYAGLMRGSYDVFPEEGSWQDLEHLVTEKGSSLAALYVPTQDEKSFPPFANHELVKEFRGERHAVLIYEARP